MAKKIFTCGVPAITAFQQAKANRVFAELFPEPTGVLASLGIHPGAIAVMNSKVWPRPASSVLELPTSFMEPITGELLAMMFRYLNRWSDRGTVGVKFVHSTTDPIIRISRGAGGYYSFLGNDCLGIPRSQQTMNLEGFTVRTAESEWLRVVPHEAGHALGCPHEHQRREIVDRLNERAVIAEFRRLQRWSAAEVRQQVLTPEDESLLTGTPHAEETSVMAYSFAGHLTKNGRPILGGSDITDLDYGFMAGIYPAVVTSPAPVPGGVMTWIDGKRYRVEELQ